MMKRYWKISSLIVVILLGISSFYIHSAYSAKQLPEYIIKKQEGNSKVIEQLVIRGGYSNKAETASEMIEISSEGSEYSSEKSFISQIKSMDDDGEQIENLKRKYRSFMRGKNGQNSFYEDKRNLVYAEIEYRFQDNRQKFDFHIAALDKKSNEETSFKMAFPEGEKYSNVQLDDVQFSDGRVNVITKNYLSTNDAGQETELHLYSFNLLDKKLLSEEVILSDSDKKENTYTDYEKLSEANSMVPSNYIVINKTFIEQKQHENGETVEDIKGNELFVYNLREKKEEEVKLTNEVQQLNGTWSYYDAGKLYISEAKGGKVRVVTYDFAQKKVENQWQVPLGENGMISLATLFNNGNMYLLAAEDEGAEQGLEYASVIVADLETGKTEYRGTVVNKNANTKSDGQAYLSELIIE